jgi:hypothetical protein
VRDLKNIDRLYQENLKDLDVFPPNKAWGNIEKNLVTTTRKKRIPIWFKIASVAALFILLFSVGTIYLLPESQFTKIILPDTSSKTEPTENTIIKAKNTISFIDEIEKNETLTTQDSNKEGIANSIAAVTNEDNKQDTSNETNIQKRNNNEYSLTDAINLPLEENNKKGLKEINNLTNSNNRFTVATIVAPIYFNSFGDGSGVSDQFGNNSITGKTSYSYGVKFAYKLNQKFSVQSGVNLINLGYKTNDVYVTPGVAVLELANISATPIGAKSGVIPSTKDGGNLNDGKASLNQNFGYIEIPVELKYNVKDGKLGVNLVGGFSTLLLNSDEVFVETNSLSQSLGSSNTLRSVNFSGNLGVDLDYSIRKNLFINVSPMFKIQTNTFSRNSGSFQPYYLGIYTGLNYKF